MTTRTQHNIRREEPRHVKVMLRMDRRLRERGVRSYRGYEVKGRIYARLNFDHGIMPIGLFGELFWIGSVS